MVSFILISEFDYSIIGFNYRVIHHKFTVYPRLF